MIHKFACLLIRYKLPCCTDLVTVLISTLNACMPSSWLRMEVFLQGRASCNALADKHRNPVLLTPNTYRRRSGGAAGGVAGVPDVAVPGGGGAPRAGQQHHARPVRGRGPGLQACTPVCYCGLAAELTGPKREQCSWEELLLWCHSTCSVFMRSLPNSRACPLSCGCQLLSPHC